MTRNIPVSSISGARLAMEASPQRRALDAAVDELHGATPCAEEPERWFPTTEEGVEWAEDACLDCPVMQACGALAEGLAARHFVGVWGGALRGSREDQVSTAAPRPSRAPRTPTTSEEIPA